MKILETNNFGIVIASLYCGNNAQKKRHDFSHRQNNIKI